jgi:hypothetical protein
MLARLCSCPPRLTIVDLMPECAAGCGDLVDRTGQSCYACSSDEAHRLDLARKRELVAIR